MSEYGYFDVGGLQMREEPARDACFKVVRRDTEMHEHEGLGDEARREMVHRHMSNEITSLDIAAQCLVDFPDTPWGLRMELARQCWDETRHIQALHRRLIEMGGYKGEFPISAFEWSITCAIDNLPGRLATQNGPGKPTLADTVISRASFPNSLDLTLSCRPLRCMIFLNWEWPAMRSLLESSSSEG